MQNAAEKIATTSYHPFATKKLFTGKYIGSVAAFVTCFCLAL